MNKILILGHGYIGTSLFHHFNSNDYDVDLISKDVLNYTDNFELEIFIRKYRFNTVINASGYTGKTNIDDCELNKKDCWHYNVIVPVSIARACHATNTHMIHISSGCIYNGYDKVFNEKDTPNFGLYNNNSSFYSKTKHAAETLLVNYPVSIFRIRMPFWPYPMFKSYIDKIILYNKIINCKNSVTSVEDFCEFFEKFLALKGQRYGIFNVVNKSYILAQDVITLAAAKGLVDADKYQYISINELHNMTRAERSNCILSTDKIESLGLGLPDAFKSLTKSINNYEKKYK
jgi:dTDP-4-dehydrorhamnose reductase